MDTKEEDIMKKLCKLITLICLFICTFMLFSPIKSEAASRNDINKYKMVFDSQYYYDNNPDVAAVYGNDYNKLLTHYINNGMLEGRNASATFNALAYRAGNADLENAYKDDYASYHEHYAAFGKNENRVSLPGKNAKKNNTASQNKNTTQNTQVANGAVLGSYTTVYDAKVPRANNVALAASRINGVVVKPGQSFSFSQTILPRTVENGYVSAPVIVNKRYTQGIGGGVCQVSSTLYAAMVSANLPATERHAHSLPSHYIPAGLDATIAGNSKDLKFTNTFNHSIIINASADNGTLTVTISKY